MTVIRILIPVARSFDKNCHHVRERSREARSPQEGDASRQRPPCRSMAGYETNMPAVTTRVSAGKACLEGGQHNNWVSAWTSLREPQSTTTPGRVNKRVRGLSCPPEPTLKWQMEDQNNSSESPPTGCRRVVETRNISGGRMRAFLVKTQ